MLHQSVSGKNQHTIELLRARDLSRAVDSAIAALELHRGHQRRGVSTTAQVFPSQDDTLDQTMFAQGSHGGTIPDPLTFVYSEGIPIPVGTSDDALVSSILVFNTALSHHLLAINMIQQNEPSSILFLQRAKKLYKLVHDSQQDGDCNILFKLAVINNYAMVDRTLGNIEPAHTCFEYILSVMMVLLDRGHAGISRAWVFLGANVMPSTTNNNTATAA